MTIKPVVVSPTQKRVTAPDKDATETRQKDTHLTHGTHSGQVAESGSTLGQPNVVVRSAASHSHSHRNVNVVIDGQGSQRRNEVYDELARHRRSPQKNFRAKRRELHEHHSHIRERCDRDKHVNAVGAAGVVAKSNSPHTAAGGASPCNSSPNVGGKSPERLPGLPVVLGCQSPKTQGAVAQTTTNLLETVDDTYSGYNSGDEHLQPKEGATSVDEWKRRDEQFAKCMSDRGYVLKPVEEDGACLFRSISLQIYGDEEMHDVIRQQTMDYIYKNREYFCHFVTEDINSYIKRKRRKDSHGNHIEIQAMSEIYSRPVEVYCYKATPINIFNSEQLNNGYVPLRLSYQRHSHYNAIIDPYNATVGVGLGLAGYQPQLQTKEAARLSEQLQIEQTMFEDKLKTTDWEATNEAMEEQIARESYLQWCRENLHKSHEATTTAAATTTTMTAATTATVTSAEAAASDAVASPSRYSIGSSGVGSNSSTFTALTTDASGSGAAKVVMLDHAYKLSPQVLSARIPNLENEESMGNDSDDTDRSSTSSLGGTQSATATTTTMRSQNNQQRTNGARSTKKRRREPPNSPASSVRVDPLVEGTPPRKSPRRDTPTMEMPLSDKSPPLVETRQTRSRGQTPDVEQLPSTSKQSTQSGSPEKQRLCTEAAAASSMPPSSFYQELLAASYATDGYGQLSESEMLQRAIQMSTQDFIEDQKRKYIYGP